jgi:hypothetical protein
VIKVERLRVNVIADVLALEKPVSMWENFLPSKKAHLFLDFVDSSVYLFCRFLLKKIH